jgi:hypothetical protein
MVFYAGVIFKGVSSNYGGEQLCLQLHRASSFGWLGAGLHRIVVNYLPPSS